VVHHRVAGQHHQAHGFAPRHGGDQAAERLASRFHIALTAAEASRDRLLALRRALGDHRGDCPVLLHVRVPGESETVIALSEGWSVDPNESLLQELDALFGRRVAERVL